VADLPAPTSGAGESSSCWRFFPGVPAGPMLCQVRYPATLLRAVASKVSLKADLVQTYKEHSVMLGHSGALSPGCGRTRPDQGWETHDRLAAQVLLRHPIGPAAPGQGLLETGQETATLL
jgi:hypothetical protein